MATVVPVNLSMLASQVLRIISLYPPVPSFQNKFDNSGYPVFVTPDNYSRDTSITSFGFPHSVDSPYAIVDNPNVFSVPTNAYAYVLPSFVSGNPPNPSTDTYTVLLIDVDATPIEPGISRLRVDYIDVNNNPQVDYVDMPFYPKWDAHPRELEEIVEYIEEAVDFLQQEIDADEKDILQVLNRMQLKGLSVSGQLSTTISDNTQPPIPAQMHSFTPSSDLTSKFIQLKLAQRPVEEFKKSLGYTITESPSAVYAGVPFSVTVSQNINPGDTLFINGFPLKTISVSGNTFVTELPSSANITYDFSLYVANKGKVLTPAVVLSVYGLPVITNSSVQTGSFANIGDSVFVNGINFGYNLGTITFTDSVSATISLWNPNSVTFIVPNNVVSGFCTLTTADGKTVKFQLNINAPTYADTFEVNPVVDLITQGQTIAYTALFNGQQVSPNWSIEDATGNLGKGTVIHGFIDNDGNFTAPSDVVNTYGLGIVANYTNGISKQYAKASLTVSTQASTLSISPSATMLEPSVTQPYDVYNNGTRVTSGIEYYINGIPFGNTQYGFITKGGLYQAPATVPGNQTVTIEAVYEGQSAFGTIRLVPLGSQTVVSHNFELQDKSGPDFTSVSWYRSAAASLSSASNAYYSAPGTFTLTSNESYYFGPTTADSSGEGNNGTPNLYIYLVQAKDSGGKNCAILIVGQDFNYNDGFQEQIAITSQLQLSATGGSFSKNFNVTQAGFEYLTTANYQQNTINRLDTLANSGYEMDVQAYPTQNSSGTLLLATSPTSTAQETVSLNGYYFTNRGFILRGFPLTEQYINNVSIGNPYYDVALTNGYSAVPDALYDLITTGNGYSFYRTILYPSDSTQSVSVDFAHNYSCSFEQLFLGFGEGAITDGAVIGSQVAKSNFATFHLTPAAPPTPQVNSVTSACPNNVVNIYGTNFSSDSQAYFAGNNSNELLPRTGPPSSSDGINYTLSVTIPNNISQQPASYPIKVVGSTGTSNSNISLVIPNNCVVYPLLLTVKPTNSTVIVNESEQMSCSLQKADGTMQDVTNLVTWYINGTQSGNATYGTINSAGFYQAPAGIPNTNNPVSVMAAYNYNGQPLTGSTGLHIVPLYQGVPPAAPPLVHDGCYMLRVSPDTATTMVPGSPIQFSAQMYIDDANPQTVNAVWSVNGVQGGNSTYGTIDSTGFYVPPSTYVPGDFQVVKVQAAYDVTPPAPNNTPLYLIGYSVLTYKQDVTTSGVCQIVVSSQININFGDGRNGFIPVGTSISLEPGQYLFATYNESLDTYFRAFVNGNSQNMPLTFDSAQANDLSHSLYNEGTLVKTAGNGLIADPSNVYSQPYTVVLGICDPTSGRFQSMWDLIPVQYPVENTIPVQPVACVLAHDFNLEEVTKSFEEEIPKTITDVIDEKINDTITVSSSAVMENIQVIWTGSIKYQKNSIKIINPIQLIQFNPADNKFEIVYVSKQKSIKASSNSVLYYDGKDLQIAKFGEKIENDSNIIVVGIILGEFYSSWPFLKVENPWDSEENLDEEIAYMRIGKALIQWGKTNSNSGEITFPVPFEKSYKIQGELSLNVTNTDLDKFAYNANESNISWVAIGS